MIRIMGVIGNLMVITDSSCNNHIIASINTNTANVGNLFFMFFKQIGIYKSLACKVRLPFSFARVAALSSNS